MVKSLNRYLDSYTEASSLALYRIGIGILLIISTLRFWSKGWIESLYILPDFHFSYLGFSWVKPIGNYTYIIFLICLISAVLVTIGYKYKLSSCMLFLSFTYIEFMDKTTYLNHYYLVSSICFLMIFLPAHHCFSVDSRQGIRHEKVPRWTVDSIKLLLAIVYIYAGLAKINSDWLMEALPLKIWLKSKYTIPIIGEHLLQQEWVHYFMSWGGMLYDISIPFILISKRTRHFGFVLIIVFHLLTKILFPSIGMFPYVMMFSSLIFLEPNTHKRIIHFLSRLFVRFKLKTYNQDSIVEKKQFQRYKLVVVVLFLLWHIIVPLRHFAYPGELLWTEEGYRFSWRVMLVEKMGYTTFKVVDKTSGEFVIINNEDHLTPFQEKQMSFQSDFILEFAHYLGDLYSKKGFNDVAVYAESYVTLNGRPSELYIDPEVDLYPIKRGLKPNESIKPFKDDIKSF